MWRRATILALLCASPSLAAAAKRPPYIALFPLLKVEGTDPAIFSAAAEVIGHAKVESGEGTVLVGRALDAHLGRPAEAALNACGSTVECVVSLGKKIHAKTVVIGRARPEGQGVRIIFASFDVGSGSMGQKLSIDIASSDDAAFVLSSSFYGLLGITDPGFIVVSGIESSVPVKADGELLGVGPAKYTVAPGRRSIALGDVTSVVSVVPGKTLTMRKKNSAEAASGPSGQIDVPVLVGFAEAPGLTAPHRPDLNRYVMYGGVGVASAGALAFVIGGIIGASALDQSGRAKESATNQIAAVGLENSARANAFGANVAYVIGTVAVALGAAAFGVGWFVPLGRPAGVAE